MSDTVSQFRFFHRFRSYPFLSEESWFIDSHHCVKSSCVFSENNWASCLSFITHKMIWSRRRKTWGVMSELPHCSIEYQSLVSKNTAPGDSETNTPHKFLCSSIYLRWQLINQRNRFALEWTDLYCLGYRVCHFLFFAGAILRAGWKNFSDGSLRLWSFLQTWYHWGIQGCDEHSGLRSCHWGVEGFAKCREGRGKKSLTFFFFPSGGFSPQLEKLVTFF